MYCMMTTADERRLQKSSELVRIFVECRTPAPIVLNCMLMSEDSCLSLVSRGRGPAIPRVNFLLDLTLNKQQAVG